MEPPWGHSASQVFPPAGADLPRGPLALVNAMQVLLATTRRESAASAIALLPRLPHGGQQPARGHIL